jgi:hypothetical protein
LFQGSSTAMGEPWGYRSEQLGVSHVDHQESARWPSHQAGQAFRWAGLYLHITPAGTRLALEISLRWQGARAGVRLLPEISLKRARDMRDDARALLRQGVDPGDERRRAAAADCRGGCEQYLSGRGRTVAHDAGSTMEGAACQRRHYQPDERGLSPIWAVDRWARSSPWM